jgi:hypothetical protein
MSNLNGWWKPPVYVDHFWAGACLVNCESSEYEKVKIEIIESYTKSISQFFKENVL